MTFKQFFTELFTWWNGQTMGTRLHTWRNGEFVGEDEFGNRYFRSKGRRIDPALGTERRWVVYNGVAELSRTPPEWRGWLTHTYALSPAEDPRPRRAWEKPHQENLTGTAAAYRPRGSVLSEGERPAATGDYVAWTPGD